MPFDPSTLQPLIEQMATRMQELAVATNEANSAWDTAQAAQVEAAEKEGLRQAAFATMETTINTFVSAWQAQQNPNPNPNPEEPFPGSLQAQGSQTRF